MTIWRRGSGQPSLPAKLVGGALYLAVLATLMFVLVGDGRWLEGWVFAVWFLALCTTVIVWLYRKDPVLLAGRFGGPGSGGSEGPGPGGVHAVVVGFAAWTMLMPLDARRFGRTPWLPRWLKAVGGALLLPCRRQSAHRAHIRSLPLSREHAQAARLRTSLAVYRMLFGQPRQEDLLRYLVERVPAAEVDRIMSEARIELSPNTAR